MEQCLASRPHLLGALANQVTSSGYTFAQLIKCGVDAPGCDTLGSGVAIGDADCFGTFAALLHPLICGLHGLPTSGPGSLPLLRAAWMRWHICFGRHAWTPSAYSRMSLCRILPRLHSTKRAKTGMKTRSAGRNYALTCCAQLNPKLRAEPQKMIIVNVHR